METTHFFLDTCPLGLWYKVPEDKKEEWQKWKGIDLFHPDAWIVPNWAQPVDIRLENGEDCRASS